MTGAVEKLIRDHELQWLVLFFQRSYGGDGNNAFDPELFEAVNIRAKIKFAGKNAVPACVAREKSDLASFERAAGIGVGRRAERSSQADFFHFSQAWHGVQPAAADDPDFRLSQSSS